jgi:hypothetical protein
MWQGMLLQHFPILSTLLVTAVKDQRRKKNAP